MGELYNVVRLAHFAFFCDVMLKTDDRQIGPLSKSGNSAAIPRMAMEEARERLPIYSHSLIWKNCSFADIFSTNQWFFRENGRSLILWTDLQPQAFMVK